MRTAQRTLPVNPPPRGILDGGGQVPLRHALRLCLGRSLAARSSLYHVIAWGLGVGIFNALSAPPVARVMLLVGALVVSLGIGYLGAVPWRWRLVRSRSRWRLVLNGIVACATGYALFFCGYFFAAVVFMGPGVIGRPLIERLLFVGFGGFIYAILGVYITTGHDEERARRWLTRESARQDALLREAREIVLRSQINPHFFFNALNTIAALIPTRPSDAERAVELLAESLRPALVRDQPLVAKLGAEIAVARAYAELELLRFGDRLTIEWSIPEALLERPIPSLSIQPLVENAIRHGVAPHPGHHTIRVIAREIGSAIQLEVANGPSGELAALMQTVPVTPAGHAIHNVRQRLRARFGEGAELLVKTTTDGSSAVALMTIPAEANSP